MDYYSRVNHDLLRLIPPDAAVVVEVGCGRGALGELHRRLNPACRYIGLEINPEAAAVAAGRLSEVIAGNAEEVNLDENSIDCLVYGDVLEHMVDPWGTLKRHCARLSTGGQVIACIPNIQHWSVIAGLLKGQWQYQPEGLLDATHLRFFTLDGIKDMFAKAGLAIFEIRPRVFQQAGFQEFQETVLPILDKLNINKTEFINQASAYQYIIRAVKNPETVSRLLLQSMLGETKVCSRVRITEPNSFLATIPGVRVKSEEKKARLDPALPGETKVFIWQRVFIDDIARQQELLRRDYLILAEMDDDPLRWPAHQANDFLSFRSCHGVQVSTEPLAEFLRRYNPNVAVFPNQLSYLPPPRVYGDDFRVRIFFGALNREDDWLPIMPELNRVLGRYPGKIQITVVHDRRFLEALETADKEFLPFCSYQTYEAALRNADIAILPLQPNRFNTMKSDLKFLECAGLGVAALASPTVYEKSLADGQTGLIYRTPKQFGEKLSALIEDSGLRRSIAANAYAWVAQNRLLCRHYRERYDWYQTMAARLPELNQSLEQRVPGILSRLPQLPS